MAAKTGFCNTPQGCKLADTKQLIFVARGEELRCPECGQDLWEARAPKSPGKFPVGIMVTVVVGVVLIAGTWFFGPKLVAPLFRYADAGSANSVGGAKKNQKSAGAVSKAKSLESNLDVAGLPATPPPAPNAAEGRSGSEDAAEVGAVKRDVLTRIDLMPNASDGDRRKLYIAVEHSRSMHKVAIVAFETGKTTMIPTAAERLSKSIENLPAGKLRDLISDPTTVFVVLGYADTTGDNVTNMRISTARAENVARVLRTQAKITNVARPVGMGPSTLFDSQQREKNRIVEVWAIIP